jgi:hypothetical protein
LVSEPGLPGRATANAPQTFTLRNARTEISCCRYTHPAAEELKAARAEWLLARKQRRQLVSWAEGNPHAYGAEKKGRRAAVLADWLVQTYGTDMLNRGTGVIPLSPAMLHAVFKGGSNIESS